MVVIKPQSSRVTDMSSAKEEVITASLEIIDDQASAIKELQAQQKVLFIITGLLLVLHLA